MFVLFYKCCRDILYKSNSKVGIWLTRICNLRTNSEQNTTHNMCRATRHSLRFAQIVGGAIECPAAKAANHLTPKKRSI